MSFNSDIYIKSLLDDFIDKRNKLKIDYDNTVSEIDCIQKNIDYLLSKQDNSVVFSPRSNLKVNEHNSIENSKKEIDSLKLKCNDILVLLEYYNQNISDLKKLKDNQKHNYDGYNLSLNYSFDGNNKEKLINLNNKLAYVLKVVGNDNKKAKFELKACISELNNLISNI